jgi:hypothetical protein
LHLVNAAYAANQAAKNGGGGWEAIPLAMLAVLTAVVGLTKGLLDYLNGRRAKSTTIQTAVGVSRVAWDEPSRKVWRPGRGKLFTIRALVLGYGVGALGFATFYFAYLSPHSPWHLWAVYAPKPTVQAPSATDAILLAITGAAFVYFFIRYIVLAYALAFQRLIAKSYSPLWEGWRAIELPTPNSQAFPRCIGAVMSQGGTVIDVDIGQGYIEALTGRRRYLFPSWNEKLSVRVSPLVLGNSCVVVLFSQSLRLKRTWANEENVDSMLRSLLAETADDGEEPGD